VPLFLLNVSQFSSLHLSLTSFILPAVREGHVVHETSARHLTSHRTFSFMWGYFIQSDSIKCIAHINFILFSLQCCVKIVLGTLILEVFVSPFFAHFHVIIYNRHSKKQNHMFEYNRVKLKLNNFLCHIETEATFFPLSMLPCLDSSFYS
jgi:hypothetical protein